MTTQSNRGMCPNAFGGYARLDKLEVSELANGKCSGAELLYRATIMDAVCCYLFFGLGRNGFIASEFLMAADYFFNVTSDKPETWNPERSVQVSDVAYGCGKGKDRKFIDLTDEEMTSMCFDQHWAQSGLCRAMPIRLFRRLLAEKRRAIVAGNLSQISEYLRSLRDNAATAGEYLRPGCVTGDLLETLLSPSGEGLASLLYPMRQVAREAHRSPFSMPRRERGRRLWTPINQYRRSMDQRNLPQTHR
ncbi:MAG: hypothetical protein JWQ49_4554 [Edaphobacter sp.]|nr:hypothetical protein [Edaphobacter sp.]